MSGSAEYYESRHIAAFEETDVDYPRWQGRRRETFLKKALDLKPVAREMVGGPR